MVFSRVVQFISIQLKLFVNFKGAVTKDISIVKSFANRPLAAILDVDIIRQMKFTLVFTINHSRNLNNSHFTHVKNNLFHCNNAAVISCSKEKLENNTC